MSEHNRPYALPLPESIMTEIIEDTLRAENQFKLMAQPPRKISNIFIGEWKDIESHGPPNFKHCRHRSLLVTLEDERGSRLVTTAKYNHQNKYWFDFSDSRFYKFKVIAWAEKPKPCKP